MVNSLRPVNVQTIHMVATVKATGEQKGSLQCRASFSNTELTGQAKSVCSYRPKSQRLCIARLSLWSLCPHKRVHLLVVTVSASDSPSPNNRHIIRPRTDTTRERASERERERERDRQQYRTSKGEKLEWQLAIALPRPKKKN